MVVAGKNPAPTWLSMDQAIAHCTRGLGIWDWASNDGGSEPDVVLACAGDVPTLETLAAADLLRRHLPSLKVRVVNVVDLMRLQPASEHPHGLPDNQFDTLFTRDRPIVFAFHGYPWLIHRLTYRRANHGNLHVRGYKEEGTTTTPFDMVMLNDLDRYHLVIDVIDRRSRACRGRRRTAPADGGRPALGAALHPRARRGSTRGQRLDLAVLTGPARNRRIAMDDLLSRWCADLAGRHTRVILSDGDDPRTIQAAQRLASTAPVTPVMLSSTSRAPDGVEVLAPDDALRDERISGCLEEALSRTRLSADARAGLARDPLYLGAAAVRAGLASGCVGGSARPTGDVIRAALRVIGLATGATALTSCFLIILRDGRIFGYGDCAVIPHPDEEQLAEIAMWTGRTFRELTGQTPAVAMLSFSTKGSADHPDVRLVRAATELVRSRAPDLTVDGELQFDAAFTHAVAGRKAPDSPSPAGRTCSSSRT